MSATIIPPPVYRQEINEMLRPDPICSCAFESRRLRSSVSVVPNTPCTDQISEGVSLLGFHHFVDRSGAGQGGACWIAWVTRCRPYRFAFWPTVPGERSFFRILAALSA